MSMSYRDLQRYINHFLRYSNSIQYKNIASAMLAMGGFELFNQYSSKVIEAIIKFHLSNLFALEGNIADLCLNKPLFNLDSRMAIEISRAFDFGYMNVLNDKPEVYVPYFARELEYNRCDEFRSAADLESIDNVIRLLTYALIIKFFISAIPPLMPNVVDIDAALLRSLMVGQKEGEYFSEVIVKMMSGVGLDESTLEKNLQDFQVYEICGLTQSAILIPVTTNSGRSYNVTAMALLRASNLEPLTRELLTGIYYNNTLFEIICGGIERALATSSASEDEKKAFMSQWRGINQSLRKSLQENRLIGRQSEQEEISTSDAILSATALLTYVGRIFVLPILIPFACQERLGDWINPLPQLCHDFWQALQLKEEGFQGALKYGTQSAIACLQDHTPTECNTNTMKSTVLNNPFNSERNLEMVSHEKENDSFMMIMLVTFIGPLLFLVLIHMSVLGLKLFRGSQEREQDIQDTHDLIQNNKSVVVTVPETDALAALEKRYIKIKGDKKAIMVLCSGCSSSYFKREEHQPCIDGAQLVPDYTTSSLVQQRLEAKKRV